MRRLPLLAVLLLLLLPVPAAAQSACDPGSTGEEERYASAPTQDMGDQVRAGTGFELHTAREESRGGVPRGHGPPRAASGIPALFPTGSTIRGDARPAPEGATPLCEHLPYHATAPPHRG